MLVLYAAPRIALLVRLHLVGPREVVDEIAAVVNWIVVLAAILIAHRGFAGLVVPMLDGAAWRYDVAFLLIASPVVGFVVVHLYRGLDPSADHLGARLAAADRAASPDGEDSDPSAATGRGTDDADPLDAADASDGTNGN